jgi:hypothetical protein
MVAFYEASRVPHKFPRYKFGGSTPYAAIWPADRLAAIEAEQSGEFTSAAMILRGKRITLNMQSVRTGGIQVELRDERFRLIPGRTFAEADTLCGDHHAVQVSWNGNADVSDSLDHKVYLCFRLRAAKLFAVAAQK